MRSMAVIRTMDAAVTRYRTGTRSNGIIPVTWEETWEQVVLTEKKGLGALDSGTPKTAFTRRKEWILFQGIIH